jgi:hypothetical protein
MAHVTQQQIIDMPIETSIDWKFGFITRDIYRISEKEFELTETAGAWVNAKVDLDTMLKLVIGEVSVLDLDWF